MVTRILVKLFPQVRTLQNNVPSNLGTQQQMDLHE